MEGKRRLVGSGTVRMKECLQDNVCRFIVWNSISHELHEYLACEFYQLSRG